MELLIVIVIISIITLIAYPAIDGFTNRDADAGVATQIARLFNRVKDQAKRRNRAYVLDFPVFSNQEPVGRMKVYESPSASCIEAAGLDADDMELIRDVPFGQVEAEDFVGKQVAEVGLLGWRETSDGQVLRGSLNFCVSADGAVSKVDNGAVEPVGGRLQILVQRFQPNGADWTIMGPPRRVEVTFAGGARMALN